MFFAREKSTEPSIASLSLTTKWVLAYALLIVAIYLSGFKPIGISADLRNYELLYNISAIKDWRTIFSEGDAGYFAFAKFGATIGWSFEVFAFALAVITCASLFRVAQSIETNRAVLVVIYGSYLFWLHEYTQIRIAAAIAFALLAIYVSRPIARWPLFLLGFLFHNSIIILAAAYFLTTIKRSHGIAVTGLAAGALLLSPILEGVTLATGSLLLRIVVYQDLAITTGQFTNLNLFSLMPIVQGIGTLFACMFYRELPDHGRREIILSAIGVVSFYLLSSIPVLAFRTYELFMPFFVILLSRLSSLSPASRAIAVIWVLLGIRSAFLTADSTVIL